MDQQVNWFGSHGLWIEDTKQWMSELNNNEHIIVDAQVNPDT
jgi:hypothetical protein